MAENIITLLFLLGMSTFCWIMVLRPSARRKFNEPGYHFWRLNKEGREGWDAMQLAGYLVGAMVFSIITVVFLFVGIYRSVAG
ncbi:MAG TPA: hypothetical protein VFD48_05760 [Pyrinomonadaceae bacterium]|nr:hypothetical protein [Pyrinomonadaceae bacterium]